MINVVVEGPSDEGIARAVVAAAGRTVARVVVKGGKANLDRTIANYVRAAQSANWVVFRDSDTRCPVELRAHLLRGTSPTDRFLLRVVHPMTEGWLLSDRAGFAQHFGVRIADVPRNPEGLQSAKQVTLALLQTSRMRSIRDDMVLRDGRTGPLYGANLNQFATEVWDPHASASISPSLARAIARVASLPT